MTAARTASAGSGARPARRRRLVADHRGAARAPRAADTRNRERIVRDMLTLARDQIEVARAGRETQYVQVVQNWGEQAGARTNHLCLDFYDLPLIPHRIGEELGGAARYVIREGVCPYLPARPRRGRQPRAAGLRGQRPASASRRTRRVRRSSCGSCRAITRRTSGEPRTTQIASAAETLRKVLRLLATASTGRPTTWCSIPRRSTSASTRPTTGIGRSTRDCARSPGWSSARACRSTRSARRTAVEELLCHGRRRQPRATWRRPTRLRGTKRHLARRHAEDQARA